MGDNNTFDGFDDMGFDDDGLSSMLGGETPTGNIDFNSQALNQTTDSYTENNITDDKKKVKRQAMMMVVGGIAAVILLILLIGFLDRAANNKKNVSNVNEQVNTVNGNNDIKSSQTQQSTSNSREKLKENNLTWTEITNNEAIEFAQNSTELVFTVTGIKHYARAVDTNNNLMVKTTLTGSLSGLAGSFNLDIPYDKGCRLVVGSEFAVQVQLGTYNGKTVVGEIKY